MDTLFLDGSLRKGAAGRQADLLRRCEELEIANRNLVKANEKLTEFVYFASHDLQEPLRSMSARCQFYARKSRENDECNDFIASIIEETARMRATIGGLLAYSQGQRSQPVRTAVALNTVIETAISKLSLAISEISAVVTYGQLPNVNADAPQLVQVFQNLIGNALKYRHPDRTAQVHVVIDRHESNYWLVVVQDNGLGFEQRYAEQIFEVFKRLHGREVAGAGIGLAICKRIVESHGGRIWATSAPGVGSQFCFTLPDA